jgi:hypothetical protein
MRPRAEEQAQPGSWRSRILLIATAALVLGLASSAQATTTNVVPNPGFEQGGCGDTPLICGWLGYPFMSQDTNAHSGNFAMLLRCGNYGCSADGLAPWASLSAHIDPAACPAIGPGTHPASFWFSAGGGADGANFGATFYSGPGCTGEQLGHDRLGGSPAGGWQEVKGTLLAPSGTQSAYLYLGASLPCDDFCYFEASFDDLDVEAETTPDTTSPETTITSGPSGTTNSTSATFEFTADEPSTFECSLDDGAFATCASPESYTGLGEGSHTFRVGATDAAGNPDPTPAEQTWTVAPNTPPAARFTYTCSGLTCSFDARESTDGDGRIDDYRWEFGDGSTGSSTTVQHIYDTVGTYQVKLTVTDNGGATATDSKAVTLIALTARGYKVKGLQKVDLSWNGAGSFDVYRNDVAIARVSATAYTDNIDRKGSGSYRYRVCEAQTSTCSNQATATF